MTRLIDADALKKVIAKFQEEENERLPNPLCGSIGLNALNRLIDYAPTVTPDMAQVLAYENGKSSERPKGKWIDNGCVGYYGIREWYCSNCKFRWITCKKESLDPDWRFCPTCGADMRGDRE